MPQLARAAEDSQASETFAQLAERGLEHRDIATGRSAVQINERAIDVHRGPGQFRRLERPDRTALTVYEVDGRKRGEERCDATHLLGGHAARALRRRRALANASCCFEQPDRRSRGSSGTVVILVHECDERGVVRSARQYGIPPKMRSRSPRRENTSLYSSSVSETEYTFAASATGTVAE
jgi:hypothetical protein